MESKLCILITIFFLLFTFHISSWKVESFKGTYGINYGRVADNILPPNKVVELLTKANITNVRIYDYDQSVLQAFSGTELELVVGLPNEMINDMSADPDLALNWVKDNIHKFYPGTRIVSIAIGNEVFGGDTSIWGGLLGAARNIYNAAKALNLADKIQIITTQHYGVFENSYPPSSCTFRDDIMRYIQPLLEFFSEIGSPFALNVYPFLAYMSDPSHIDINYALFEDNAGIVDPQTNLHYNNLLDAQIDAAYAALEAAGFGKMNIIITETGWASKGDADEVGSTPQNARTYNSNLRKKLAMKKGTPLKPEIILKAYIFAIFNEDLKPGPTSERNFGLWKPDGSISYNVGFPSLTSSAVAPPSHTPPSLAPPSPARGWCFVYAAATLVLLVLLSL